MITAAKSRSYAMMPFICSLLWCHSVLAEERKVLILGDEAVESRNLSDDKKIHKILEEKSQKHIRDLKIQFVNVSSEETSPYGYLQKLDSLMVEHSPQLIVYIVTKAKNLERELKARHSFPSGCPVTKMFSSTQQEFAASAIGEMVQSIREMKEKAEKKSTKFLVVWNMPGLNQDNFLSHGSLCKRMLSLRPQGGWVYKPSDVGIQLTNSGVDTIFSNEFRKVYWQEITKKRKGNWTQFQENYIASFTDSLFPWIIPFLTAPD